MAILGSRQDAPPQPQTGVPEYDAEVNKGSISIRWLPRKLNDRAQAGWRLHTMFEQDGNTVMVFERWR